MRLSESELKEFGAIANRVTRTKDGKRMLELLRLAFCQSLFDPSNSNQTHVNLGSRDVVRFIEGGASVGSAIVVKEGNH